MVGSEAARLRFLASPPEHDEYGHEDTVNAWVLLEVEAAVA